MVGWKLRDKKIVPQYTKREAIFLAKAWVSQTQKMIQTEENRLYGI